MSAVPTIEVVYALPEQQHVAVVPWREGITAGEALAASGILTQCPELSATTVVMGVFGVFVAAERCLQPDDRLELYRPLVNDPRTRRRRLAAQGRTMRS